MNHKFYFFSLTNKKIPFKLKSIDSKKFKLTISKVRFLPSKAAKSETLASDILHPSS